MRERGKWTVLILVFAACVALLLSASALAASVDLLQTFTSPSAGWDDFGMAMAPLGTNVLIGAEFDGTDGYHSGIAYLYNPSTSTGNPLITFSNPTHAANDYFGAAVAAIGNQAIIGAYKADAGAGAVYSFDASTGVLQQTFSNPAPSTYKVFGHSLATSGNELWVSAFEQYPSLTTGKGTVFRLNATTKNPLPLAIPSLASGDWFGYSIAKVGNKMAVGAPQFSTGAGVVYLFDAATGDYLSMIANPTSNTGARFGSALGALGDKLLVGASEDGDGKAYLFDPSTGAMLHMFESPDAATSWDMFGSAVAGVGNNIVIGNEGFNAMGRAYLFDGTTYSLLATFPDPTPSNNDEFGFPIVGLGSDVMIGARFGENGGSAAYLFEISESAPEPAPVPEPVTLASGAIGLACVGAYLRRRGR